MRGWLLKKGYPLKAQRLTTTPQRLTLINYLKMGRGRKRPDLYQQLLELLYLMQASGERVQSSSDILNGTIYSRQTSGEDFRIQQAIVIMDTHLWDNLSSAAIKMVIRIQSEMRMNNVFWHFSDTGKKNVRTALAELKKKQILLQTETPGVYIINPFKLRRGKPLSCIVASLNSLTNQRSAFPTLIDMKVPKHMVLDGEGEEGKDYSETLQLLS